MKFDRLNISLRAQLTAALVAVVLISTAALAIVAYHASRRSMREEAVSGVSAVADSRAQILSTTLHRRHERALAIINNIELGCGISGRMNRVCAREALAEFVSQEDARAARLTYGRKHQQVDTGDMVEVSDVGTDGSALVPSDGNSRPIYIVRASDPEAGASVELQFDADDLQTLFATDELGRRTVRVSLLSANGVDAVRGRPIVSHSVAVTACLAQRDGVTMGLDEQGSESVQAYRYVPDVDACVLAKISTADVYAPAVMLRRRLATLSAVFALVATGLALALAQVLARPIAQLTRRVRSLERGDFDSPVPETGSSEVKELSQAFRSMADSLNQSRQALIQSEGRLKMTYRAARLWPWEYDVASGEIRWNDSTGSRVLRETMRGFLGRVHPEDRRTVDTAIERAKTNGQYEAEYRMLVPNSGEVWVSGRGQVIYDNAHRPVLMVGVNLDTTARKQAEHALIERERLAATGRMAASLAHEVNNPLASITSAL